MRGKRISPALLLSVDFVGIRQLRRPSPASTIGTSLLLYTSSRSVPAIILVCACEGGLALCYSYLRVRHATSSRVLMVILTAV